MTNAYTQLQLSFSVPVGIGAYTHLKNQMCKAFFFFGKLFSVFKLTLIFILMK